MKDKNFGNTANSITGRIIYFFSSPTDKRLYKVLETLRSLENENNEIAKNILKQSVDRNKYYLRCHGKKEDYTMRELITLFFVFLKDQKLLSAINRSK